MYLFRRGLALAMYPYPRFHSVSLNESKEFPASPLTLANPDFISLVLVLTSELKHKIYVSIPIPDLFRQNIVHGTHPLRHRSGLR
jgi:hypothetical protein